MATTYTPNYHLGKQEDRSDKFVMKIITDNMDIIDEQLKATDDKATAAAVGLKYKGAVNYYSDLPNDTEIGDAYTVLYAGSSGTVPDGTEYVWGELSGTAQWIDFSKDSYTKAEVNTLLAAKQATLTAGTGLSFGTGSAAATLGHSNSTTAQSTQAFRQVAYDAQGHITGSTAATTAQAAAINSGITSTDVEQINTNKNNISSYHKASGTSVFYGETEPTDSGISAGSYWISSSGIKIFGTGATKAGEPPISFISNGDSLSDYTIIGASGGVGNQTENIFNKNVTWYRNNVNDSTNHTDISTTRIKSDIQDISDSNSYISLKIFAPITNMRILGIGFFGDDVTTPLQASAGTVTNTTVIQPIPNGAKHYYILLGDDTENITNDTKTALVSAQICAIYGNTLPSDYIPYGYVIPVTCGGTTTSIYIDNQLGASDSVTFSTTQVTIPTSSGSNILTVGTTVQPASVSITYTGWK